MIADEGCAERGCPMHDSRLGPGVHMVRKEWVGLTDGEIESLAKWADKHGYGSWHIEFARAIEDELKEKNT